MKADNLEKPRSSWPRRRTGAELVVLPEKWNGVGPPEAIRAAAEPIEGGETVEAMRAGRAARHHARRRIGLGAREGREKRSNTCVVFDPRR